MKIRTGNRLWLAIGYLVLLGTLGALLAVALAGIQTRDGLRVLLQTQSRWSSDGRDAIIHLQRFGRNGNLGALEAFEQALTYPRLLRDPLRVAAENPGDGPALVESLRQDTATAATAESTGRLARHFAGEPRARQGIDLWWQADRELARIEALADRMAEAVQTVGTESDEVRELLTEVDAAHARLAEVSDQFTETLTAWVVQIENRTRWGLVIATLLLAAIGSVLLWVTGRKLARAREDLLASRERFHEVTRSMREVFWLTDVDKTRMLYVSPGYEGLWGRSRKELYRNPAAWLDPIHPDDRERVRAALDGQREGVYDVEYRIVRPDGEVLWIHDRAAPVRDASGHVARVAGIAEDVTHRRELESELVRSRAALGVSRMARVVGHELNNLLTTIRSHAELALDEAGPDSPVADDLAAIDGAAKRCADVTADLLSISRQQILVPRPVHVERLLQESREMMRAALPDGVDLSIESPYELPPASIDPGHVREALTSLLVHAAAHEPELVWLELDKVDAVDPLPVLEGELSAGAYLRVAVGDDQRADRSDADADALMAPIDPDMTQNDPARAFAVSAARGVIVQSGGGVALGPESGRPDVRFLVYLKLGVS